MTNDAGEILDLVFFPGFPLLAGMLMTVLPEMLSAYLAAWIPFLIAGQVLYRLFRLDYDRVKSLRILLWLCLLPGAVFYSYPMSESLFLAAAAGTVYLARTRRWFAAGVCGFLAAFTRSTGVLLAVPLGIELLEQYAGRYRKDRKQLIRDGACMLMIPLAFTLIMIGFANVIRTQVVLPQERDQIFVKSVCTGAVVNLAANACLIPSLKSMGAVIGTLLAEMAVPTVQYLILRKELPYRQYLKYFAVYALFGGIMLASVRLTAHLLPQENWWTLAAMTATGIAVYTVLCLGYWKITGKSFRELA